MQVYEYQIGPLQTLLQGVEIQVVVQRELMNQKNLPVLNQDNPLQVQMETDLKNPQIRQTLCNI